MSVGSFKEDDDRLSDKNIHECSKCSSPFKNGRFRYRRHPPHLFSKSIYSRRWHFLLALSSWHSISVFLLVTLLSTWKGIVAQKPPPNYAHGNMPETNFTCDKKTTGGYYADPEAGCQMFHVCVRISEEEINDYKFLCPNNTVFDQKNFICTNWWEIDCEMSTKYYNKNDLFKPTEATTQADIEYVDNPEPVYYEYVYEYVDNDPSTSPDTNKDFQSRHRLSLGKSTLEEKAIHTKDSNSPSEGPSPFVSSSVSVSKPRTTFSTSSVDFSEPSISFKNERRRTSSTTENSTPSTTTSTTTTTTTTRRTTTSVTQSKRDSATGSPRTSSKNIFDGVIGQSVIEPAFKEESEDPFANYDWKKDSSNSRSRGGRQSTNARSRDENRYTRKRQRQNSQNRRTGTASKADDSNPKAKLSEFSNFRFYKTAFGVSYSSDDYFSTTEEPSVIPPSEPTGLTARSRTPSDQDVLSSQRRRNPDRPNRGFRRFRTTDDQTAKGARLRSHLRRRAKEERTTASRTTRYSKYAAR